MNEYYEYFGPDYKLDVRQSNMEDMNTREYLERVKGIVLENVRKVGGPPSVQMTGVCGFIYFKNTYSVPPSTQIFPERHPIMLMTTRTKTWMTQMSEYPVRRLLSVCQYDHY